MLYTINVQVSRQPFFFDISMLRTTSLSHSYLRLLTQKKIVPMMRISLPGEVTRARIGRALGEPPDHVVCSGTLLVESGNRSDAGQERKADFFCPFILVVGVCPLRQEHSTHFFFSTVDRMRQPAHRPHERLNVAQKRLRLI